MRASRGLSILAGTAAITLASLLVASPASAATLPSGQQITVVEEIFAEVGPGGSRMYDTSPVDATSTAIGAVQGPVFVPAIDVNDDGLGYATVTVPQLEDSPVPYLYVADANTGALSGGVEIVPSDGDLRLTSCPGIDLQPNGEILVACVNESDGLLGGYIGVVTLAGVFTEFYGDGAEDDTLPFTALAFNAVTGELWAFSYEERAGSFAYLVNRAAGTLGPALSVDGIINGADFDRDGQLFVTSWVGQGQAVLATLTLTNPTDGLVVGAFTSGGNPIDTVNAITVWGKPALPDTGAEVLPVALGSALLLLAGAAFIVTARLNRRAA